MKKRILAAILAFACSFTAFCLPALAQEGDYEISTWTDDDTTQAEPEQPADEPVYPDVLPADWFYDDVLALAEAKVISGFPDGTFRPQETVTTGQALKMILLAAGYDEPPAASSHWARGYLDFAIEQGFLTRFVDITDLDVGITRALVAKLAAQALGLSYTGEDRPFTDTDDAYAAALQAAGIVGGYPDGSFGPQKMLTRAELSAIVHRILTYRNQAEQPDDSGNDVPAEDFTLRTTQEGVRFIQDYESFTPYAYWDYAQYSIGYGSRCGKDEYPDGITQEEAVQLMRRHIHTIETELDPYLEKNDVRLSDAQYDALISLCYNIGTSWLRASRLSTLLKSGDYTHNEFASAMGVWCHVTQNGEAKILPGLIKRRIMEIRLFLYEDYQGNASNEFYYLIFDATDGSLSVDVAVYEDGSYYDPLFEPEDDELIFDGWFTEDGSLIDGDTRARESLTVYARWTEAETDW